MKEKIMIVDDSGLSRRVLRRILETVGYAVVEADDGMSALERFYLEKPDLTLLDMVMKGMTGLEVLEKLRTMDPAARILVATADIQSSTKQLAEASGAIGVICKPFSAENVLIAVKAALAKGEVTNVID
jgi:two-component system, chemotaxis family, chemotaxis protein CheY